MDTKIVITKKTGIYFLALIILASLILIWVNNSQSEKETIIIEKEDMGEVVPEKETPARNATPARSDAMASGEQSVAGGETPKPETEVIAEEKLPAKILIDVPFTSQAPFGKWDSYHEEACEEASLLMATYFLKNKKLTPAIAEKEIQALIAYQLKTAKKFEDSTAEEVVKLGEDYYGLKNLRVVYDFTMEDLKKYLAQKKPIIIPAAGRLLGNPNFTAPGPLYHNLVLVGYDGDMIITNDPGTRKGQGYRYSIKTLYGAIHDFSGDKNKIETGRKAMIVVE